jgi:hypothetical protein
MTVMVAVARDFKLQVRSVVSGDREVVERLENLQVTDDGCGTDDTLQHKGMLLHQGNVGEN